LVDLYGVMLLVLLSSFFLVVVVPAFYTYHLKLIVRRHLTRHHLMCHHLMFHHLTLHRQTFHFPAKLLVARFLLILPPVAGVAPAVGSNPISMTVAAE
jgi:hypothetical protein